MMPPSSPATGSSGASTHRIRRRRVTTACTACRDRRVKCDRIRPLCAPCRKAQRACHYAEPDARGVEWVAPSIKGGPTPPSSETWNSVIDNQAQVLRNAANENNSATVWAVAEAEEPSRPHMLPPLQRYKSVPRPYNIPVKALGEQFLEASMNHFPSRKICQPFFENFQIGIHPIVPVCDIPTLQQLYDDFWESRSPSYSVESLALVLAVLYTGAANAAHVDIANSSVLLRLYEDIFSAIDFASYHAQNLTASIQLIQACIIMKTYQASQLAPFSAFGFLPQAIRFAQSLRLHIEKKIEGASELQTRRRMWWHLVFLDVESTVATGLPCIIHRSGFTTHLPSLHQDSAIESATESYPAPSPMMIAVQGHYHWAQRMQAWFENLPSKDDVLRFKAIIENLIDLIPDNEEIQNGWARSYLKMQVDHAYCMLGLRFWQLDQYKGTGCDSEVIETSRSFLNQYRQLSTLPAASQFAWFIPGLIQPLHALIILLMHLSTCTNIHEKEVRSRSLLDEVMSLRVNRILNGSVVPTKALLRGDDRPQRANPRYLILVELRRRVWEKMGWDADGKGVDPWSGRVLPGEIVGGGEEETLTETAEKVEILTSEVPPMDTWSQEYDYEESTGLEGLDSILAGDPLDMFQWDEWENLASEFFAF